jgi:hypothetical protein
MVGYIGECVRRFFIFHYFIFKKKYMLRNLLLVMLFALAAQANAAVCTVTLSGDWSASMLHIEEANSGVDTVITATSAVWFRGTGLVTFTYSGISGNEFSYTACGGQSLFSGALNSGDVLTSVSPLPVDLVSFEVIDGHLEWQTAWEENNKGFEIQYAENGTDWAYIGFLGGAGTSVQPNFYRYPVSKKGYYRLKQIDFDGKFEYSKVVFKRNSGDASEDYKIYGKRVVFTKPQNIAVYNQVGALLYQADKVEVFENLYNSAIIVRYDRGAFRM